MADRKVFVHVKQSGESGDNKIDVSVRPWTLRSKTGDSVTFVKMNAAIVDIAISKHRKRLRWPFARRGVVRDIRNAMRSLKRLPVKRNIERMYTITVTFRDHANRLRKVSIDPDMVIET